jgi:hypothetical protein
MRLGAGWCRPEEVVRDSRQKVGSPPAATDELLCRTPFSKDGVHVWYVLALFRMSM